MNLYNRAEKYKKYYFWDFGMILTGKGLSNNDVKDIADEMGIECVIKKEFPPVKLFEITEIIRNEERLNPMEKQDLLSKLPNILKSMRLERYEILVKAVDKEIMEKYFIQRGLYPIFLEDSFVWKL